MQNLNVPKTSLRRRISLAFAILSCSTLLALVIVNRICAAQGWQCHIHSQAGQGTQIAIQIQPLGSDHV